MTNRLSLHTPKYDELWYRQKLLSDSETMNYNKGYNLGVSGYNNETGCIDFSEGQWQTWYDYFIGSEPERYYAYIVRKEDNAFIGEVNLHKSKNTAWYDMGIVLGAKYRSKGYAVEALKLLLNYAFHSLGAKAVHNDFEETRVAAVKTHLSAGFCKYTRHDSVIELVITREQYKLQCAIDKMTNSIRSIFFGKISIYLYGSVAMNDFKLGWSDIDILCLTENAIDEEQANTLVTLRQTLFKEEPDNPYYCSFEGGMLTLNAFLNHTPDCVVYWGTSGQRITDSYHFDSFSMAELLDSGKLLCGKDVRTSMKKPLYEMLYQDVMSHYETIRKHAATVSRSIKSYGWLLDIARCIYTLRTGNVIAKTAAGEWALENDLCPVKETLETAVIIRKEPLKFINDEHLLSCTESLGEKIQLFADVLKTEINNKQKEV